MKLFNHFSTYLVAFTLVGVSACGGGDAAPEAAEGGAETAAPVDEASAGGEVSAPFQDVYGSAAEGTFVLTLANGGYSAVVNIETHRGPGDYPVRIHSGNCAAEGTFVLDLTSVEGQEGGEGSSRSEFPATELPAGPHAVRLYDAQAGNALACAEIPEI